MLELIRYKHGEPIYGYYWKFDESKLSESAKELCAIICNQLCKKNNKPYGTISGKDLDKYHIYYYYYAFEGDSLLYRLSVAVLIDNFEIWSHAGAILENYKKQAEKNKNSDIFDIISDFTIRNEILGGDDITSGMVEFSEEDCVCLGYQ